MRHSVRLNHLNERFEAGSVEWRLAFDHLKENAAEGPEIRRKGIDPCILEQLGGHVVGRSLLVFLWRVWVAGALARLRGEVGYLFAETEVTELKVAELVDQNVGGL